MRRKIMALLLGTILCVVGTACGSTKESAASEAASVEEDVAATEASVEEEAAATEAEATKVEDTEAGAEETVADDSETAESSDEEGKYIVFTDATNAEVEEYAQKIVDAVNAKDWEAIGDMIQYPIGSEEDNSLCNNKEEFLAYANSTGFSEEELTSLASWDISDLWANYQGACIADGSIWFRDLDPEKKDLKIVSFLGLREPSGEISD